MNKELVLTKTPRNIVGNGAKKLFLFLIWVYRHCLSPLKPRTCRFEPTCSEYATQAITKYGPWRGLHRTGCRLLRCHPWNQGGFDPLD